MEIKIDPEFQSLIPPISEDEKKSLEESIIKEGCRDALVLWDDVLLDGHNRFEICQKHEIKFKTIGKTFDDREGAKIWIINNQLSRRNLTPAQMSNLRGMRYNLEKKEDGQRGPEKLAQNDQAKSTAQKLAKEFNVSPATIRRDAKYAKGLNELSPEEKKKVLSGKWKKTKKEVAGIEKPEERKLGPPCRGMQYARLALLHLEQIPSNDTERRQAFSSVEGWINEHEPKPGRPELDKPPSLVEAWIRAGDIDREEFTTWFRRNFPDPLPDIPAGLPIKSLRYVKRLKEAYECLPKKAPTDLRENHQEVVTKLAGKIFFCLQQFIVIRPSEKFLERMKTYLAGDPGER